MERRVFLAAAMSAALTSPRAAAQSPQLRRAQVSPGVTLHYSDEGTGTPIVFVHGSTSDYRMWQPLIPVFAQNHRVITYSRRYNFPNANTPAIGYSAEADAVDLADLLRTLGLPPTFIVGHSYGAFATLFLLQSNPQLVRAAVLAEPPAVTLLPAYPPSPALGRTMLLDVRNKLEGPIATAFRAGDKVAAMRAFYDYVAAPGLYAMLPPEVREQGLVNSSEWEVIMQQGTLFPTLDPALTRQVRTPTLLLAGTETNPFLMMIHETLAVMLQDREVVVIPSAPHPMFATHPQEATRAVLDFLGRH